jgi:serine/threonine protein kinase
MSKNKYIDEFGNIHYLDDELGRGGQGVVYKTKDADTVIKIALSNEKTISDEKEIKKFHQTIKRLIFKPLPNDINIATPLAVIKNKAGYVMNLLDGMKPFSMLFPSEVSKEEAEKINMPEFLQSFSEKDKRMAFYFAYYLETGGLRKRLYTLSRLAITLNRLHIRGLIYFDISHNNIFINNDEIPLVYLIDADNIEYESINKSIVYTPNFEVPEVVNGEPNSLYSDIYAFGILSFLTLTTTHPFNGESNGEADWDSEEEKKEQWELPWIEDSNDDSNKSKAGLRHTLTITDELSQLFHKLFEEGKIDKFKRPTLPLWIESLEKSASKTIKCSDCGMSYYEDKFDICPYCKNSKPKRLIAISYVYKDDKKIEERWKFVKEITEDTKSIELPIYLFKSFDLLKIDDSFLEIVFSKKTRVELYFEKEDEVIYFESNTPMVNSRKRVSLKKLENGIEIRVEDKINILVEVEIK